MNVMRHYWPLLKPEPREVHSSDGLGAEVRIRIPPMNLRRSITESCRRRTYVRRYYASPVVNDFMTPSGLLLPVSGCFGGRGDMTGCGRTATCRKLIRSRHGGWRLWEIRIKASGVAQDVSAAIAYQSH